MKKLMILLMMCMIALSSCGNVNGLLDGSEEVHTTAEPLVSPTPTQTPTPSPNSYPSFAQESEGKSEETSEEEVAVLDISSQEETVPTTGEKNALRSAKDYLSLMPFSYDGLIGQLEYEQYTHEEAVYAADNCGADWNEQAAKSAKSYLELMAFSKDGLIKQLEYEGFTHEQAVYGVEQNGY